MKDDPIVEEVRQHRRKHAEQFDFDLRKIAEDLRSKQKAYKDRVVTRPPKRLLEKVES